MRLAKGNLQFKHTRPAAKVLVQARIKSRSPRNRSNRLCLGKADLDQGSPAGGKQTAQLRDQHAVGIKPFHPGEQRARRFESTNRSIKLRRILDIGRIGQNQVKLPQTVRPAGLVPIGQPHRCAQAKAGRFGIAAGNCQSVLRTIYADACRIRNVGKNGKEQSPRSSPAIQHPRRIGPRRKSGFNQHLAIPAGDQHSGETASVRPKKSWLPTI